MVADVNAQRHRITVLNDQTHRENETFIDVLPAYDRYFTVDLRVHLNIVTDVNNAIRLNAQHDQVRHVEAVMVATLVHGGVCDADVVRPLVELERRASAQVRHRVVKDEFISVYL